MEIRQVNPDYLDYLRFFDPHIPTKDRPWLWPIHIDGITYGIPCTTRDTGTGHMGFLKGFAEDSSLNLRFMVPIPESSLKPPHRLPENLQRELQYYEEIRHYISSEAQLLHRLSTTGLLGKNYTHHSCDYTLLEQVYTAWHPGRNAGIFLCPETKEVSTMPTSKNGKLFYTKEQYEIAKYINSSALKYALSQGYELVKQNAWYRMKEHDSMVFTPTGAWFWNSRGLHGDAIDFQIYYEGKTLAEAVLTLAGEYEHTHTNTPMAAVTKPTEIPSVSAPKPLVLPERSENFRRLFYYLCQVHGLDKTVVQEMIAQQRVYESRIILQSGKEIHNACFVYQDPKKNIIGIYQRGMSDYPEKPPYKRDAPGSDKNYGWMLSSPIHPATTVQVFEGAIDAASSASIIALQGKDWREQPVDRLSLEGLNFTPLKNYLETHPDVRNVTLMLDADHPGRTAASDFAARLEKDGYNVHNYCPSDGKDINAMLLARISESSAKERTEPTAEPER